MSWQFIQNSPERGQATQRQVAAQDTGVSVWVAASAGAGKTRVLTNRMMRLLLEGAPPQSILALTYTRAAAKEMANRLIDQARDLAAYGDEARQDFVQGLLGHIPDGALQRAQSLYETILEVPGGLQIQTIHAFCQSLLGRFPFEAGLTPGFEPIEDAARTRLLSQAVETSLVAAPYPHLTAMANADKVMELATSLVRIDWAQFPLNDRLNTLEQTLGGGLAGHSQDNLTQQLIADLATQRAELNALISACLAAPKKPLNAFGQAVQTALQQPDPFPGLQSAAFTNTGTVRDALAKSPQCADSPVFDWLLQRLSRHDDRTKALRLYELNCDVLAFGQAVTTAFQGLKAAQGVLDFDDLIAGAGRLLSQAGGPTYVQYRLDQQINHILLDEAQDTSAAQWQVIAGLAEPFFDDASAMDDRPRTLFVVGDFKQSIYSFQGADPHLFSQKRQGFQALAGQHLQTVDMVHSFRSAPLILKFVDAVAARITGGQGHDGLQAGLGGQTPPPTHTAVQQERQGRVEIWPAPPDGDPNIKAGWQPLRQVSPLSRPRALLGQTLARHIHRLCFDDQWANHPSAYLALGRRVQPGDFLILLQNRKPEFADALMAELKALRVPVTGVDRLKVSEELLVQDLLALGDICLQPGDDLALAALLKSPFYGWDEQRLGDLALHRGMGQDRRSLMAQLADQHPDLHAHFLALRGHVGRRSVYEFYASYLFSGGMRARVLAALGPEAEDVLTVFLDRARGFDLKHNGDLLKFIEGERQSVEELKRDSSQSAGQVRLMTVHGAKGLEAPIVILCDLRDPTRTGGGRTDDQLLSLSDVGPLWVPKKELDVATSAEARKKATQAAEAERERLFYVALTRAEERLIIATDQARQDRGNLYTWYNKAMEVLQADGQQTDLALSDIGWASSQGWALGSYPDGAAKTAKATQVSAAPAMPAWIRARMPAPETGPKRLSPSQLGADDGLETNNPYLAPRSNDVSNDAGGQDRQGVGRARALQRGILIHAALEHLPADQPQIWPQRLTQFFAHQAPDTPDEERAVWTREVIDALTAPELAAFFGSHSQSEVTVSGQIDGQPALGQIDRLWVDAAQGTVHILDYKTNRPPPTHEDQVPPAYRQQLHAYAQLIHPLYPNFAVRTYLFWTHTTTLMPVS